MARSDLGSTPREAGIVRSILRELNKLDRCVCRKLHGSEFSTAGDPDLYGCYQGRMFLFEVKSPGGNPTNLQVYRLKQWEEAGAITGIVRSTDEALRLLGVAHGGKEGSKPVRS